MLSVRLSRMFASCCVECLALHEDGNYVKAFYALLIAAVGTLT